MLEEEEVIQEEEEVSRRQETSHFDKCIGRPRTKAIDNAYQIGQQHKYTAFLSLSLTHI